MNLLTRQVTMPEPALNLLFHGDSITFGNGVQRPYPHRVVALIWDNQGVTSSLVHEGVNGISFDYAWPSSGHATTMIEDAPALIDAYKSATKTNWLTIFAGTNGAALAGNSAATEFANFETYLADRLSAGFLASNIIVGTMLPRGATVEAFRTSYNSLLVSGATTYGYKLARFDQNATIGEANDNYNSSYYLDDVHPNDAGSAIMAQIIYDVIYP